MRKVMDLADRHSVDVVGKPLPVDMGWFGAGLLFEPGAQLKVSDRLEDFEFSTGPFCVEFCFFVLADRAGGGYSKAVGTYEYVGATYGWGVWLSRGYVYVANTWSATSISVTPGPHVFALERNTAGDVRICIDGLPRFTWTHGTAYAWGFSGQRPLVIGSAEPGFSVVLSHLRVTAAARYFGSYVPVEPQAGIAGDSLWNLVRLFIPMVYRIGPSDDLLRRLLPLPYERTGDALGSELSAYGAALDATDAAAAALLVDSDPRTTSSLLSDWERVYGLTGAGLTDTQRRSALTARMLAGGGQSRTFFIQLAAAMGYTADIVEFVPHTVDSDVDYPLYGVQWRHIWQVHAHAGSSASPAAGLESLIRSLAPAHTYVLFKYY